MGCIASIYWYNALITSILISGNIVFTSIIIILSPLPIRIVVPQRSLLRHAGHLGAFTVYCMWVQHSYI